MRNILFDIGILDSKIYKIPTIGIGNLSIGGTGKSILVDYLINLFKSNYSITTLSRGYNRDTKGFVHANSKSTAYEIGDEPFQFYSKHPEINVVVCEDRRKGMNIILNKLPQTELCIWDDIYQHRFIKPGLMILTTTYGKPYTNDKILPLGKLRESISSSKRADIILITKCPEDISNTERERFTNSLNLLEHQKVYYSSLTYSEKIKSKSKEEPITIFNQAINNIKPTVEVRSRRVGGATYQVPVEVKSKRSQALALRWLIDASRKRKDKNMSDKIFNEIFDAYQNRGSAIKKKEDTHKMAESNKAFAHFRW